MITQMKKYTFLVFHKQYDSFLTRLRDAGVLHVRERNEITDDMQARMQELLAHKSELEHLLSQGCTDELHQDLLAVKRKMEALQREADEAAVWGEFDAKKVDAIRKAGCELHFLVCREDKYQQWGIEINRAGGNVCFVVTDPAELQDAAVASELPTLKSPAEYRTDIEALEGLVAAAQARIEAWQKVNTEKLQGELAEMEAKINWQCVLQNTDTAAGDKVCVLEGYAPIDKVEALDGMLEKEGVYYEVADPTEEDEVPIKLRNNKITRIFECLTGMYGMPVYQEWDPTPILAPFYLLFFALCMGDMAYGVILIIYGLLQSKKIVNIAMFDGLGPIITVLGVATTIVGFFMNTVFGVPVTMLDWHPDKVAGYDFWMVAAIVIGVFHICLAMTVKAISQTQRFGFKAMISTWAWLLLIVGSIATLLVGMACSLPTNVVEWTMIGIGIISALGIYVFNTPGRNPLINIGAGLWDTYNMATGLLGDVLSYIRLYALGLAGGMLGNAFNNLAIGMVWGEGGGSIGAMIGKGVGVALILVLGHTLNLLMACLGAFVHPLRLTFVEYFKNAGYEGKGKVYAPFKQ